MFAKFIIGAVVFICLVALAGVILAFPTMWLWNSVCPKLFHLPIIDGWDALYLNILCGILFKGAGSDNLSSTITRRLKKNKED